MRNKWLRRIGVVVLVIVGLLVVAAGAIYAASESRLTKTYTVPSEQLTIPTDPASIEHGQHLVESVAQCGDCHGANYAGKVFLESPGVALITSANLTRGKGGIGSQYTDADQAGR